MAKRPARVVPLRTCIACRATAPRATLHRIVRAPSGAVRYDPGGKAPGRGAYLCGRPDCLAAVRKRRGHLERALRAADPAGVELATQALRAALERGTAHRPDPSEEEVRTG